MGRPYGNGERERRKPRRRGSRGFGWLTAMVLACTGCTVDSEIDPVDRPDGSPAGACGNGEVDPGETCDFARHECCNRTCDGVLARGTECRPERGVCDVPEVCDGMDRACPPNGVAKAGTVCREADGDCDVAEVCDGTTRQCPPNGFRPDTRVCRPSAGSCDIVERCRGDHPDCPPDRSMPADMCDAG